MIFFAFTGLVMTNTVAAYVCGDSNGDQNVNVSDAVNIINYVFVGGEPPVPMEAGDCNCDGNCNISDAVAIINFVFIGGYEPCDPNGDGIPDCGFYCPPTVTDYDGNIYQTVQIGDQCWMAENLKVTHYRNGNSIPSVTDYSAWSSLTTGAYCNYGNDISNVAVYGRLYNWHAVNDSRGLAPQGWHIPSDTEWKQLEMYLGMSQADVDDYGWRGTNQGGQLKETGTSHWLAPNTGATNISGFTALPAGDRLDTGAFYYIQQYTGFWSTSLAGSNWAWNRGLAYNVSSIDRTGYLKTFGYSVRCVKD